MKAHGYIIVITFNGGGNSRFPKTKLRSQVAEVNMWQEYLCCRACDIDVLCLFSKFRSCQGILLVQMETEHRDKNHCLNLIQYQNLLQQSRERHKGGYWGGGCMLTATTCLCLCRRYNTVSKQTKRVTSVTFPSSTKNPINESPTLTIICGSESMDFTCSQSEACGELVQVRDLKNQLVDEKILNHNPCLF